MAFQVRGIGAPAATLWVKFWPEPSKWDDRRRRPRSNTQPMQFAVAEIVPAADKFRELLQKLIAPDTRNAMAMAISVALIRRASSRDSLLVIERWSRWSEKIAERLAGRVADTGHVTLLGFAIRLSFFSNGQ